MPPRVCFGSEGGLWPSVAPKPEPYPSLCAASVHDRLQKGPVKVQRQRKLKIFLCRSCCCPFAQLSFASCWSKIFTTGERTVLSKDSTTISCPFGPSNFKSTFKREGKRRRSRGESKEQKAGRQETFAPRIISLVR